jgi:hypothetical protein
VYGAVLWELRQALTDLALVNAAAIAAATAHDVRDRTAAASAAGRPGIRRP